MTKIHENLEKNKRYGFTVTEHMKTRNQREFGRKNNSLP